ncbi:hypothetical protein C8J57DRAFT_1231933 [Mycena rebaudengoi]|nr:hypothetical protein C8J57DRAFT_1240277 [Mycena rebaudengoi]KAJ7248348.1 hypothetical protein C8J57DRAFT_1240282 [Mycena rebaudengoi]KAJ7262569.1 hypothetical protein C8J57DRAFT_1231933 [Mycena rebaudengoi]
MATTRALTTFTTKSLFQVVCEIFGGLGGQGERMGGRGTHLDSPPAETRLIAPKVAGSADGEVKSWGALGSTATGHVEDKHTTTARRFFLRACAAQMEKEFKSSRRLELAENGGRYPVWPRAEHTWLLQVTGSYDFASGFNH